MATRKAYQAAPVSETCPQIDAIISHMEELRKANAKLREWGAELYDEKEQLESDLEEAKDTSSELHDELDSLREELKEAQQQAASA